MTPLSITTIVLYLTATVQQYLSLNQARENPSLQQRSYILCLVAVVCHAIILFHQVESEAHLPLGFFNALSVTSFLVLLIILFTALKKPVLTISLLVMPFAAAVILLADTYPSDFQLQVKNSGLEIHILTSLIAYSLFTIAALQALLVAYQDKKLRTKSVSFVLRTLPPLQLMEQLLIQIMVVGFIILTLSLLSGAIFLDDIFAQHLVHKTALSIIAWLVFAILLYGRWQHGWRGQTLTSWTISGFVSLLLAYFGSKFVLELLLQRV